MKTKNLFHDRLGKAHQKPEDIPVKKRASVYGLAIKNNQILMVKPVWSDWWEIPGGGIKKDETDDLALMREYKEETGYLIKEMDMNKIDQNVNNFYKENEDAYFRQTQKFYILTSILKLKEHKMDPKEIKQIQWINIFSMNKDNCNPIYLKVIRNFIKYFSN